MAKYVHIDIDMAIRYAEDRVGKVLNPVNWYKKLDKLKEYKQEQNSIKYGDIDYKKRLNNLEHKFRAFIKRNDIYDALS